MMHMPQTASLEALHKQRTLVRIELAQAWERHEPKERIHRIEDRMRAVWAAIEAAERVLMDAATLAC
ncbi:MAG: hypothetical protein V3W34_17010 [Phycisphaerae bacterium]